jgi:hypothetical protein
MFPSNYASGDRTPKQKVKLKVTEEKLLKLLLKYNGGNAHSEVQKPSQSQFHLFIVFVQSFAAQIL